MSWDWLPPARHKAIFWTLFWLTLAFFAVFSWLDAWLVTPASSGIVSYELAGSVEKASAMLAGWDSSARAVLAFGLGLDYLFMPVYASTLSLGIFMAAWRRKEAVWQFAGKMLGWGAWLAVVFDASENALLFSMLLTGAADPMPALAALCAGMKFLLLLAGLVYALIGWRSPNREES